MRRPAPENRAWKDSVKVLLRQSSGCKQANQGATLESPGNRGMKSRSSVSQKCRLGYLPQPVQQITADAIETRAIRFLLMSAVIRLSNRFGRSNWLCGLLRFLGFRESLVRPVAAGNTMAHYPASMTPTFAIFPMFHARKRLHG
jgi:hypothetical protein